MRAFCFVVRAVDPVLCLRALDAPLDLAKVVEIVADTTTIARVESALQLARFLGHRVEHAAIVPRAGGTLGRAAALPEHPLEHDAWIDVHRQRRRGRAPRDRVEVHAVEAGRARAHIAGEVLGCDFDRRERRVLSDLLRDDLIDAGIGEDVLGLGSLRPYTGEEPGSTHGVIANLAARVRARQVGDEHELILVGLDRLEDRLDVESRPDDLRNPLLHDRAVRNVDGAEPRAGTRLRTRERRERREHRIKQRQCDGRADTSQERTAGQCDLGYEHQLTPNSQGANSQRAQSQSSLFPLPTAYRPLPTAKS